MREWGRPFSDWIINIMCRELSGNLIRRIAITDNDKNIIAGEMRENTSIQEEKEKLVR